MRLRTGNFPPIAALGRRAGVTVCAALVLAGCSAQVTRFDHSSRQSLAAPIERAPAPPQPSERLNAWGDPEDTGAHVAPQPSRPARTAAVREVIVQQGDTLTGIAQRHNVSVSALIATNNLSSSVVQPGQRLVLPNW